MHTPLAPPPDEDEDEPPDEDEDEHSGVPAPHGSISTEEQAAAAPNAVANAAIHATNRIAHTVVMGFSRGKRSCRRDTLTGGSGQVGVAATIGGLLVDDHRVDACVAEERVLLPLGGRIDFEPRPREEHPCDGDYSSVRSQLITAWSPTSSSS
ncbi:MAG: hypothetical protein QM820_27000 [Minicystis sp.]